MYSYITIAATPDGKKQGLGRRKFQTPPRIGEFIELEENGMGFIYKVLAIIHPNEPIENVGDLYVTRIDETVDFLKNLYNHL
ncbi:MAG: hypothetical protein QG641_3030 [Candidatus Poribacteria bacterium]|nr:hypothetical protein [Euryarchaeota archaeon]MDQ1329738.1 hypothetical protein [Candidatus Poribacteria bacterium]